MDYQLFARTLLSETLFYDAEYGLYGSVSLIDMERGKEMYLAAYDPEEQEYQIERATEWDTVDEGAEDEFGYAFAKDGELVGRYASNLETADALMAIAASEPNLLPGFVPEIEEG